MIAVQRGTTDPGGYVIMSGDIDSRISDVLNAADSHPGANDNASGVAGVLEAARVLSRHRFRYAAKLTALNAATLAALAAAPGPPHSVRISGAVQPAARLRWEAPEDSGNVAGYRVYWRRTDSPTWDHATWVGSAREHTFSGLVIDNWFFGVASVGRDGHESTVVFPTPGRN